MTSAEIAKLNDLFRDTLGQFQKGRFILTRGVSEHLKKQDIIGKMVEFDDFSQNDTYKEHDFGAFSLNNEKFYFKIGYYTDNSYQHKAKTADKNCYKVLTLLKAKEF